MKRLAKKEDCTVVCGRNKPIIMEVIGENGEKVAEYVDDGKDTKRPYYRLEESTQMDWSWS